MSKRIRSWLFIIFILLFVVGTILVSLYASGYKINFNWPPQFNRLLIKTGMIIVDSHPEGAIIYLDNEPQAIFSLNPWSDEYITTSNKVRNVPPGEYMIRLEREGYWPWEKKISVYPNQATTLIDINLFRSDTPEMVIAAPEGELSLSPTGRYLYVGGSHKIVALRTGRETTLSPGNGGRWRQGAEELLSGSQLYAPGQDKITDYQPLIGTGTINFYDDQNDRLYYSKDATIGYLNTSGQAASLALSGEDILAFLPRADTVWVLTSDLGRAILKRYPLPTGPAVPGLELPGIGRYEFRANNEPRLTLYDSLNKTLYIINPDNPAVSPLIVRDVLSWEWINKNTLLYNNNWEIFRLDVPSGLTSLLTRVGEEIREIVWNAERNYLIFSTVDSLQAYDPRLETITKIFRAKKILSPVLDADNEVLYFWAEIDEQSGAYRLSLQ